jgi:hypothetical protein
MQSCNFKPVELLLATTDAELFNGEKWLWNGELMWTIQCIHNQQESIADNIIPNIPIEKYLPIKGNPSTWNFCNSNCDNDSKLLHIVFTFNPQSNNPNDYLQYVINIDSKIYTTPRHDIIDKNNKAFSLDIVDISTLPSEKYVEIWIGKSIQGSSIIKTDINNIIIKPKTQNNTFTILFWIFLSLIIIILLSIIVYFIIYRNSSTNSFTNYF